MSKCLAVEAVEESLYGHECEHGEWAVNPVCVSEGHTYILLKSGLQKTAEADDMTMLN